MLPEPEITTDRVFFLKSKSTLSHASDSHGYSWNIAIFGKQQIYHRELLSDDAQFSSVTIDFTDLDDEAMKIHLLNPSGRAQNWQFVLFSSAGKLYSLVLNGHENYFDVQRTELQVNEGILTRFFKKTQIRERCLNIISGKKGETQQWIFFVFNTTGEMWVKSEEEIFTQSWTIDLQGNFKSREGIVERFIDFEIAASEVEYLPTEGNTLRLNGLLKMKKESEESHSEVSQSLVSTVVSLSPNPSRWRLMSMMVSSRHIIPTPCTRTKNHTDTCMPSLHSSPMEEPSSCLSVFLKRLISSQRHRTMTISHS